MDIVKCWFCGRQTFSIHQDGITKVCGSCGTTTTPPIVIERGMELVRHSNHGLKAAGVRIRTSYTMKLPKQRVKKAKAAREGV